MSQLKLLLLFLGVCFLSELRMGAFGDKIGDPDITKCAQFNCPLDTEKIDFGDEDKTCQYIKDQFLHLCLAEDCCEIPGYPKCTTGVYSAHLLGDGVCDDPDGSYNLNNKDCGYEFGDCCECSCHGNKCKNQRFGELKCRDPRFKNCMGLRVGCYKDFNFEKDPMKGDDDVTVASCSEKCRTAQACLAFGVQGGNNCYFTKYNVDYADYTNLDSCTTPCAGDGDDTCGGDDGAMEVFDATVHGLRIGCVDTAHGLAKGIRTTLRSSNGMSTKACALYCEDEGDCKHYGLAVEYENDGQQLCYGDDVTKSEFNPTGLELEENTDCNSKCGGDKFDFCGGEGFMEVYSLN